MIKRTLRVCVLLHRAFARLRFAAAALGSCEHSTDNIQGSGGTGGNISGPSDQWGSGEPPTGTPAGVRGAAAAAAAAAGAEGAADGQEGDGEQLTASQAGAALKELAASSPVGQHAVETACCVVGVCATVWLGCV